MGKSLGGWGVWEERKQGEPPAIMYKRLGLAPVVSVLSSPTPQPDFPAFGAFFSGAFVPFLFPSFFPFAHREGKGSTGWGQKR